MTSEMLALVLLVIVCIVGMRTVAAKAKNHQREVLCKGEDEGLMPTQKHWSVLLTKFTLDFKSQQSFTTVNRHL